ncbi:hypothetical protein BX600DRAFT_478135 [Xylariales sp. PMI_506]|nr:hypothetical protein BX600DRAFT_478135 [Xylariales sp. PMI_506]
MVNVGGRSKGCSPCRKRRVKCDERHPVCARCQRCGLACDGPRAITFVKANIVKSRRTIRQASLPLTCSTGHDNRGKVEISTLLSLRGFEIEMSICYARRHLSTGGLIETTLRTVDLADVSTGRIKQSGSISHQTVLSLAAIFFGLRHKQDRITRQGYALQAMAFQRINQALSDSVHLVTDEVIKSVVTLAVLEFLAPSSGANTFLVHMKAVETLLDLQGPGSQISSVVLYRSVQQHLIVSALCLGRPSILARPDWKAALRTTVSAEELLEQDLYDILADCTVLFAQRVGLSPSSELLPGYCPERVAQLDDIEQTAQQLLAQLGTWKRQWDRDKTITYDEDFPKPKSSRIYEKQDVLPFSTVYKFPNQVAALQLMLYNIALTHVLQILRSPPHQSCDQPCSGQDFIAQRPLRDTHPRSNDLEHAKNGYYLAQAMAVLDICRCVPYHLDLALSLGSEPSSLAHWAILTAWVKLGGRESAVGRWLYQLLLEKSPVVASFVLVYGSG